MSGRVPPSWCILDGDCVEQIAALPECSVDAVVCDPPYGIGFMGHEWDQPGDFAPVRANGTPGPFAAGRSAEGVHDAGGAAALERHMARSARRGTQRDPATAAGHEAERERARFGGPAGQRHTGGDGSSTAGGAMHAGRYDLSPTANRRFQAWCEAWASEALRALKPGGHLLVFGSTRTYHRMAAGVEDAGFEIRDTLAWIFGSGFPKSLNLDGDFAGWGTSLKPGYEPVVVARKPLAGTVAATVLAHGTGALNVDACRVPFRDEADELESKTKNRHADFGSGARENVVYGADPKTRAERGNYDPVGRWPANVLLDVDAATELGAEARFFYCAKASTAERNAGLDHLPMQRKPTWSSGEASAGTFQSAGTADEARNPHPTVKPIDVMRWLVRLVTPPGGTVLDPFTGSGTTGCAAVLEGFHFIGCERDADYIAVARARIGWWAKQEPGSDVETAIAAAARERKVADTGQASLDLFGEGAVA